MSHAFPILLVVKKRLFSDLLRRGRCCCNVGREGDLWRSKTRVRHFKHWRWCKFQFVDFGKVDILIYRWQSIRIHVPTFWKSWVHRHTALELKTNLLQVHERLANMSSQFSLRISSFGVMTSWIGFQIPIGALGALSYHTPKLGVKSLRWPEALERNGKAFNFKPATKAMKIMKRTRKPINAESRNRPKISTNQGLDLKVSCAPRYRWINSSGGNRPAKK